MTKIKRITQKIFGGNAPADDIAVMGSFKSGTPVYTDDIEKLQNTAYEGGYGTSLVMNAAPFMEEQNSVPYVLSKQLAYLFQEGIPEYDKDTTYYVGSICKYDGVLFTSVSDNNKGHQPDSDDGKNWTALKTGGGGSGLEVCDIGMSLFVDETKGLRRRLNGQIVDINTNTQGFLTRLKQITTLYPSLLCTEEEWQTIKSASKLGQCGKFVFNYRGAEIVSVRIPAVVNINGLVDMANAGLIKEESLPNITGTVGGIYDGVTSGAFKPGNIQHNNIGLQSGISKTYLGIFNASHSSSTYQDNAPVQQEAVQYPYFIQIATGQETEVNIKDKLELNNPFTFGMNMYFKGEMENISWLKSANQQNPKASYPDFYNWVLTNANAGKDGFKLSTASDITDYDFVINTTDETFRLPLKNGLEGVFANGVVPTGYNLYYFVGVIGKNPGLIDAGRIAENMHNMANINLSNLSDFGKIMCAKNAFAQIHYDPNDFSKIGAYWGAQNLTSGSVNFPDGGLWLSFVYKYNANSFAGDIGSVFEAGIVPGGTKFTVEGNFPHYYFYGIRIQEA